MSHTIECTVKAETDLSLLVVDHDTGEKIWLPFSHVDKIVRDKQGVGSVTMDDWIAREKGLK